MNYYQTAKILQEILEKKANFKKILFDYSKKLNLQKEKFKKLYTIVIKSLKNFEEIKNLLYKVNEYFHNDSLRFGGKLKRIIQNNKEFIKKFLKFEENSKFFVKNSVFVRLFRGYSINKFKEKLKSLDIESDNLVKEDEDIPNLIEIPYSLYSKILEKDKEFLNQKDLVVQGKSSCLPAYFLLRNLINFDEKNNKNNEKNINNFEKKSIGFDIIDCCAAPGNKTLQLAEYMLNFGKVFAFEKNTKRYEILLERVNFYGFTNVECLNQDFLETNPDDIKFKKVRFILLDPSCSGSGMLNNIFFEKNQSIMEKYKKNLNQENSSILYKNMIKEINFNCDENRLKKLQTFQIRILKHCLKFPIIKIAYSTCSLFTQENEQVISEIIQSEEKFKLVNSHKFHSNFSNFFKGISNNKELKKCLRTNILKGNMDGFFVAILLKK